MSLLLSSAVASSAIPGSVVDNFEDYSDGPYRSSESLSDYYSGDLGYFSRSSIDAGPVYDGSYSLECDHPGSGKSITADGTLPNYPSKGDTVEWRIHKSQDLDYISFGFGQDTNNRYYIDLFESSRGGLELYVYENGSQVGSDTDNSHNNTTGEWMRMELTIQDPVTVVLEDSSGNQEASASVSFSGDVTGNFFKIHGNGNSNSAGVVYYDEFIII